MFPIRDHNPAIRTPYVTWALIAANVLVFLLTLPIQGDPQAIGAFYFDWGLVPARAGSRAYPYFTSMFLHAGFMHILVNMLFLWIFGDNMEEEMGHVPFLVFYIGCGLAAALIHVISDPFSRVPTVGASGAIAGVMGGYLLMFPRARIDVLFFFIVFFRIIPISAWIVLGLWFGFQVFRGVFYVAQSGGVAYWAHIGGFVVGMILTVPLWIRRGGRSFWTSTKGHPPRPETQYARSNIPIVRRRR